MAAFIAQSALSSFLLSIARHDEPEIREVALSFAAISSTRCNWRVSSIDHGLADPSRAQAAVAAAVRGNSAWIMVGDEDPRDGIQVEAE